jgi:hypothetical protein
VDRLHRSRLLKRAVAGAASTAAASIGAASPQILPVDREDQPSVDRLVDRLGAHLPVPAAAVPSPQPPTDLRRGPPLAELSGHDLAQLGIHREPMQLRPAPPQIGLVVRKPRLVAPVGLPVPCDLPVDGLVRPTDPRRDLLHRLAPGETVGDLDPIILRQITGTARRLHEAHPASVDEPQRPAAQRHTDLLGCRRTREATSDQLEVAALDLGRHLVRRIPWHPHPFTPGFATTNGIRPVYPILYLDALVVKVRDNHAVRNKAAHIAVGVDTDGVKHVLGIWVQTSEGAKFWAGVLAELRNRGVQDVLIACCDGLTGFPEAIEATWPQTMVQTCVVHLIRASMRVIGYNDRKAVAAALRPIYTAPTEASAAQELDIFEGSNLGKKYPATVRVWRDAWQRFIPFLEFPPELRKIIYTTNSIESLNYQLRKIIKNRGHFPNDDAVVKLLWLAIRDIEDKRARERAKEAGRPKGQPRNAPPKLVEGAIVQGWNAAFGALSLAFPGRLEPKL